MIGIIPKRAGSVRFEGAETIRLASRVVARLGIGYVPEERLIFPNLTVAENLSMGIWRRNRETPGAIERVLECFPRLRDRFRARGGTLSGGEQQMLSIGRALMSQPRLLLVDEPTEGLAPVIVQTLERTLAALAAQGLSVLVVESKLAVARRIASRIYVMAKGRTVFHGTPEDLQSDSAARREYLEV